MGAENMQKMIAVAVLALAGCAMSGIKEGMDNLNGRPVSEVFSRLGTPNDERVIGGRQVYIWGSRTVESGTERSCEVRVVAVNGLVASWDARGNEIQCWQYSSKLTGERRVATPAPIQTAPARAASPSPPALTLNERLAELKKAYDAGLISESVYLDRQKKILESH